MRTLAALFTVLAAVPATAGGFYLQEQSPTGVGRAFAGEAAIADGPATIFFNPAGMTQLPGNQLDLGVHLLSIKAEQRDRGTTRTFPGVPGSFPVGGGDGGNPFDQPVYVPSTYASFEVAADRLWFGLGISAPFGLKVVYDDDFFGRYDSIRSRLTTFNIQPSLALKLNEQVSIGGGLDLQTMSATLTSALPNLGPALPDGRLQINGHDSALGWNAGVLVDLGTFRLGGHYRSHIDHRLSGLATFSGLLGPLAARNGAVAGIAPISTPDIATASAVVGFGPARLLGSVTWTNWSRFERITVENPSGAVFLDSEQNYRDTWSYALGAEFDVSNRLTVRAGTMFDETPTVDRFRTTRVPDGNRWWASGGVSYELNRLMKVNLSYAHVFVKAANVDRIDPLFQGTPAVTTVSTLSRGTGNVDQLAGSLTLRF